GCTATGSYTCVSGRIEGRGRDPIDGRVLDGGGLRTRPVIATSRRAAHADEDRWTSSRDARPVDPPPRGPRTPRGGRPHGPFTRGAGRTPKCRRETRVRCRQRPHRAERDAARDSGLSRLSLRLREAPGAGRRERRRRTDAAHVAGTGDPSALLRPLQPERDPV